MYVCRKWIKLSNVDMGASVNLECFIRDLLVLSLMCSLGVWYAFVSAMCLIWISDGKIKILSSKHFLPSCGGMGAMIEDSKSSLFLLSR